MPSFDDFLTQLRAAIAALVTKDWSNVKDAALKAGSAFVDNARTQLASWTTQLANGSLSQAEFSDLVAGEKDLVEIEALTQAGLAEEQLIQFRTDVINTVVQTATKVFA